LIDLAREEVLEGCGHSERLLVLADWAARRFGLGKGFVDGARLHDVGKLFLPRYDLLKRPLNELEKSVLRLHVLKSWEYVEAAGYGRVVQEVALLHHQVTGKAGMRFAHPLERWDGKGYFGLAGEAIPLSARVMAVLDAYDAMRSQRPYREARGHEEAWAEIRRMAGSQFDPQVVGVEWPDC
jgi:HD-GYP domain-containing protein (c-di-GMP phosphodiesterase class II)